MSSLVLVIGPSSSTWASLCWHNSFASSAFAIQYTWCKPSSLRGLLYALLKSNIHWYLHYVTLYQFNQLSESEQEIILRDAALIDDREDAENTIYLFQIDSFYVEVYCHKSSPSLSRYWSFSSTDQLAPYLEKMKIDL